MPKKVLPAEDKIVTLSSDDLLHLSNQLTDINNSNSRITELLWVLALPIFFTAIGTIFRDGKQMLAYDLSDGARSTRDIGKIVGIDQKSISTWWREWDTKHHLMIRSGNRGPYKKKYSLLNLVIKHYKRNDKGNA